MPAYVRERMGAPNNPLKLRAAELGITLVEREWVPSSRRAHECTELARAQGKLEPFHAAVLRAYWSEGKDLHEWSVLEACAEVAGVEGMRAAVEAGAYKTAVDERVVAAHELGIHAVPTFLFADKFLVQGAQTLETFERVMERL